jgi:hypothetical protein
LSARSWLASASSIRKVARPDAREQRRRELAAGDKADHEGAQPKTMVHMKRQNRQGETNDQEGDRNHRHDGKVIRGDSSVLLPRSSLQSARASKNYNPILFRTILHPTRFFCFKK